MSRCTQAGGRKTGPMKMRLMVTILLATLLAASAALAGDGYVVTADSVRIHYTDQGSGKPTLVFVHGWSCDASYWDAQVPVFAKTHRVIAIDLAGHGSSATRWAAP